MSIEHELPYNGVVPFRKYYAGYLRGLPNIATVRSDIMKITEYTAIVDRLQRYVEENACAKIAA